MIKGQEAFVPGYGLGRIVYWEPYSSGRYSIRVRMYATNIEHDFDEDNVQLVPVPGIPESECKATR